MPKFKSILTVLRIPELRKRIGIVLLLLAVTRVVSVFPLPGVSGQQLVNFFQANQALNLLNLFTGGGLANISIALMGVGPYITASIIFQLLTFIIPSLENLQKEGEIGRQKINQYTRLATVPLAIIQSFGTLTLLRNAGIIESWNASSLLLMLVVSTAGSLFLMWIGELISEYGIGNGISLIITTGIIAGFQSSFVQTARSVGAQSESITGILIFSIVALATVAAVVMVTEGVRNIPITYARNIRGKGMLGKVSSSLPVKINSAGVIPIIFAISLILIPSIAGQFLQNNSIPWLASTAQFLVTVFDQRHWVYLLSYFILVFAFTYFYTFIIIKPEEMAENLQRQGGFVPGVRPGNDTAEYIYNVVNRLTFPGALFLATIAIFPIILQNVTNVTTLSLNGTSVLIIVSVVLETIRQIETQISARTYDHTI